MLATRIGVYRVVYARNAAFAYNRLAEYFPDDDQRDFSFSKKISESNYSYCYAWFMKRVSGHSEEWGEFVDVKVNAPMSSPAS